MTGPQFTTNNTGALIANPSSWQVQNIVLENQATTLGGMERVDVLYRKHRYILEWNALSVDDYNALQEVIQDQIDNSENITFTWGKFATTASGVECIVRMPVRGFTGGSGSTKFYSNVSVEITEISRRA